MAGENPGKFAEIVRTRRKRLRLSQAALAQKAGLKTSTISGIELGTQKGTTRIDLLARALQMSTEELRAGLEPREAAAEVIPTSAAEARLILRFRGLSARDQGRVEGYVAALEATSAGAEKKRRAA